METSTLHHHIEQNSRMQRLVQPNLSLPEYADIIYDLKCYYSLLEDHLGKVEPLLNRHGFDFAPRRKLHLLEQDLETMLARGIRNAVARPRQPAPPVLHSLSEAVGCLYVIEGSTLGSRIISKHLAKNLGLGPKQGGSFFYGYGARTGLMWKHFKTFVSDSDQQGLLKREEAVSAAKTTFANLATWMS